MTDPIHEDFSEDVSEDILGELLPDGLHVGDNAQFRIWGFLGGAALIGGVCALAYFTGFNRVVVKIGSWVGIVGLGLWSYSFHLKGAELNPAGIHLWSYWAWFIGSRTQLLRDEIDAAVLGQRKGKFNVTVRTHDGRQHLLPQEWPAVNDARNIVNFIEIQYGAETEVAIQDARALDEVKVFEGAPRLDVHLTKSSERGYRAEFNMVLDEDYDHDEAEDAETETRQKNLRAAAGILDGLRILIATPFFGRKRAEFQEADGETWILTKGLARDVVYVEHAGREMGRVRLKKAFWGGHFSLVWDMTEDRAWHATFQGDEDWDPITLKFYPRDPKEGVSAGAILDGDNAYCTLDVADPAVCPWVPVALGSLFMLRGSSVTVPKQAP